jgi:hypothetical protein
MAKEYPLFLKELSIQELWNSDGLAFQDTRKTILRK